MNYVNKILRKFKLIQSWTSLDRGGGGQVVSMLAFHSDNPSLQFFCNFFCKIHQIDHFINEFVWQHLLLSSSTLDKKLGRFILTKKKVSPKWNELRLFCVHCSDEDFDVVFLQEVWYERDFDFLGKCAEQKYFISDYDRLTCGGNNKGSCTLLDYSKLVGFEPTTLQTLDCTIATAPILV